MSEKTPTMAEVIQEAIKSALANVHTQMPACVESYDRNNQLATVRPCIKRVYSDGREQELSLVYNVPIVFQGSGDVKTHYDLKAGDEILLVFSERSIDKWIVNGGIISSGDRRRFDLSDGIGIAGLRPNSKAFTPKGDVGSYEVQTKNGLFEITESGAVVLNNGKDEFFTILVELVDKMILGKNLTATGPQPKDPAFVAELEAIKAKLEGFVK